MYWENIFSLIFLSFSLIHRCIEGVTQQEIQFTLQYMIENHYTVLILLVWVDITVYILPDYQLLYQVNIFSSCDIDRTMWCGGPPLAHNFWSLDTEFNLISGSIKCDGTN